MKRSLVACVLLLSMLLLVGCGATEKIKQAGSLGIDLLSGYESKGIEIAAASNEKSSKPPKVYIVTPEERKPFNDPTTNMYDGGR